MADLKEIEARRAARKERREEQRQDQYALDLEALDRLEEEHGDGRVLRVDLESWEPTLPTMIVLRLPKKMEFKRYQDVSKKNARDAAEQVASCCRLYPDDETYKRLIESFPAVHVMAGAMAVNAAGAKVKEEGKE